MTYRNGQGQFKIYQLVCWLNAKILAIVQFRYTSKKIHNCKQALTPNNIGYFLFEIVDISNHFNPGKPISVPIFKFSIEFVAKINLSVKKIIFACCIVCYSMLIIHVFVKKPSLKNNE